MPDNDSQCFENMAVIDQERKNRLLTEINNRRQILGSTISNAKNIYWIVYTLSWIFSLIATITGFIGAIVGNRVVTIISASLSLFSALGYGFIEKSKAGIFEDAIRCDSVYERFDRELSDEKITVTNFNRILSDYNNTTDIYNSVKSSWFVPKTEFSIEMNRIN